MIDQGDLDDEAKPTDAPNNSIIVAPEVVHLSRFADSYKVYRDAASPTGAALCLHNAGVAQKLQRHSLVRMWKILATLLQGARVDRLPFDPTEPMNAIRFALLPATKKMLEEQANVGNVQTCVAICEILQVFPDEESGEGTTTRIPGLEVTLVREWYLSYIDLLQDMCLFSHAAAVIRVCKDPVVAALNQQSTT